MNNHPQGHRQTASASTAFGQLSVNPVSQSNAQSTQGPTLPSQGTGNYQVAPPQPQSSGATAPYNPYSANSRHNSTVGIEESSSTYHQTTPSQSRAASQNFSFPLPTGSQTGSQSLSQYPGPATQGIHGAGGYGGATQHHTRNFSQPTRNDQTSIGGNTYVQTPQQQQMQPLDSASRTSLQGNSTRPNFSTANTAPSGIPTLPPLATQIQLPQQAPLPSSRSTMSHHHSHSYSQPSSAGLDQQRYAGHGNTPDDAKFASPPSNRYTASRPPQATAYSPLGLADIRPRADSGMSDGQIPSGAFSPEASPAAPTNCNYLAPWAVYAFDWCKWPVHSHGLGDSAGKMAIGSYLEDGHNFIQILETQITPDPEPEMSSGGPRYGVEYTKTAEATHSYPVTRILWEPESSQKQSTDLLATSGDHLRLWSLPANPNQNQSNSITRQTQSKEVVQKLTPLALLSNSKSPEHTAPLTSLDWNTLSPSLIITSSIDTTCTIWDIPSLTAKTQLIAHDKEVFDVRFCAHSVDVFVSCGADGSVRMFDLRSLEHSTIIYEPSEKNDKSGSPGDVSPTKAQQTISYAPPLLRLAASPHDAHLLATFSQDSNIIRILDVRQPGQALLELQGHSAAINCMEWSPTRRGLMASGGDDSLVLIWDLLSQGMNPTISGPRGGPTGGANGSQGQQQINNQRGVDTARGPASSWQCDYEVGNLSWAPRSGLTSQGTDWLGVSGGRGIWSVNI
ncbi:hypothetical protein MMC25_002542 [Agyrium rufum]|nr:hypothetical protein [Agyrium rufum]